MDVDATRRDHLHSSDRIQVRGHSQTIDNYPVEGNRDRSGCLTAGRWLVRMEQIETKMDQSGPHDGSDCLGYRPTNGLVDDERVQGVTSDIGFSGMCVCLCYDVIHGVFLLLGKALSCSASVEGFR